MMNELMGSSTDLPGNGIAALRATGMPTYTCGGFGSRTRVGAALGRLARIAGGFRGAIALVPPACLSAGLALAPMDRAWSADDVVTKARAAELVHLVRQDCGSCHGLTLKGGLGPALTADALYDKPAEGLVATIVGGRPGTPMPPFRGLISEAEAEWIVEQLMAGFPETAQATEARK